MKTKLFALLLLVTTFISCGDVFKKQDFYLSNPTNDILKVFIDGNEHTLQANTHEVLTLKEGKHTLKYEDKVTNFNVFTGNTGGIINPTLAPHYIFSMVYATEGNFSHFKSIAKPITIDGVVYEENIKSTNALLIDNNLYRCTYSLGEAYPDEINTHNKQATGNFFNKFFTKKEILAFIADQQGTTEPQGTKAVNSEDTITEISTKEIAPIQIPIPELQAIYEKKIALATEYRNSTDAKRQKEIQKELFDISMSTSKLNIDYSALTVPQNQSMNDFEYQIGAITGAGIIELN